MATNYNASINYNATLDYNGLISAVVPAGGPAGGIGYPRYRRKKRKYFKRITVRQVFVELTEPDVPVVITKQAESIVSPFVINTNIDWIALEKDIVTVLQLKSLLNEFLRNQDILDDDEEIILLDS